LENGFNKSNNFSPEVIAWMVCIAAAILRAFGSEGSQSLSELAQKAGASRPTLYQHLHLSVEALKWVYQNKQRLSQLLGGGAAMARSIRRGLSLVSPILT
jgi:DNA-binding IclR family transcriptional regulator